MSPAYSSDVSWCGRLARALHTLMIIVIAALVGGVVGGFGVFALVTVMTMQHRGEMAAVEAPQRRQAVTTLPAVAPAAQQAPMGPNPGASDAKLATAPSSATPTQPPVQAQASPAAQQPVATSATTETSASPATQPLSQTPATTETHNAKFAKKHFTVTSRTAPAATNDESIGALAEPNRKVFDYYENQRLDAGQGVAGPMEDAVPTRSDAQRPWLRSGTKSRATKPRLARRQQRPREMYGSQGFGARRTIGGPARPYYYADQRYGWGSQYRWGGGYFGGGDWRY
jgi:hypothetical protein